MKRLVHPARVAAVLAALAALLSAVSCGGAASGYGSLSRSFEVAKIFEDGQVLPGYAYYFSGPPGRPDAILGVKEGWTLDTRLWRRTDLTSEILKKWLESMNRDLTQAVYNQGAHILAPDGGEIGVWYSPWAWTVIRVDGEHVTVKPPSADDPILNRFGGAGEFFRR